jgi:LmbE family N-acetylglucosaminyl deacetylase
MKKILIIAPHMDDEVLGCGGSIAKHQHISDGITVIFVAHRVYNHHFDERLSNIEKSHALRAKIVLGYNDAIFLDLPDERLDASVQEIIIPLEKHIQEIKPEIVYIPFRGDNNQDHRAVFDAARVALRPVAAPFVCDVYMYEIPSSTDQSPPLQESAYLPNYYVDVSGFLEKKLEAYNCYETEKRGYPHPRSEQALRVLAQKRGTEIGFNYAEAFMILRKKWC